MYWTFPFLNSNLFSHFYKDIPNVGMSDGLFNAHTAVSKE